MPLTADLNQNQLTALEPRGDALPAASESNWVKLKLALGDEFSRIELRALELLKESDPRTVYEMLPEYEELANLPDCFTQADQTLEARRDALQERLTRTGGQSISYMKDRASAMGHEITITETEASKAGGLEAGQELSGDEADRFAWQVNVAVDNTYAFVSGASESGDELGYWAPVRLECLLDRIKPGHTMILYNYIV